jgi:hypothetical protein
VLKDHADPATLLSQCITRQHANIGAINQHLPLTHILQPVKGANQAGFTRPAAANDAEDFAALNVQVNIAQRFNTLTATGIDLANPRTSTCTFVSGLCLACADCTRG